MTGMPDYKRIAAEFNIALREMSGNEDDYAEATLTVKRYDLNSHNLDGGIHHELSPSVYILEGVIHHESSTPEAIILKQDFKDVSLFHVIKYMDIISLQFKIKKEVNNEND